MTETEWLTCGDSSIMLETTSLDVRKLRLFSSACCRYIESLPQNDTLSKAVEVNIRYADGIATFEELSSAFNEVSPIVYSTWSDAEQDKRGRAEAKAVLNAIHPVAAWNTAWECAWCVNRASEKNLLPALADLLRHIVGNPFRPFTPPTTWASTVTGLADALYDGEDCHYALADALMESGHIELAEHFHEPGHPKGCWPLDVILGKQ